MQSQESKSSGRLYWQSLEHIADTPEVRALMANEFHNYSPSEIASMPRRRFLKVMGASLALSGLTLTGCRRWPREHLAPYTQSTPDRTPGVPEQYATTFELGGIASGVLANAYDGRPIKIEGNPSHPWAATFGGKLGSADRYAQASVLELYDPDRSRAVVDRSTGSPEARTYEQFLQAVTGYVQANCPAGAGVAVLSEASDSPSVADARQRLLAAWPQARWYEYEPISFDNERDGIKSATGKAGRSVLKLEAAECIVSLDCDFHGNHPAHTRYSNDYIRNRRMVDQPNHNSTVRLLVAESQFSLTGANADERLGVKPSRIESLAAGIAAKLGVAGVAVPALAEAEAEWVDLAAGQLKQSGAKGVVTAGPDASPATHSLVFLINSAIGAVNSTVTYVQLPDRQSHAAAIAELSASMKSGGVKALLILGGNPAFDAPADLAFGDALKAVPASAHLSYYVNETSLLAKWHVPRAHYLECWGDGRAWDGTISTAQPLIEPLFGGKSVIEVLAALLGDSLTDGQALVRRTLTQVAGPNDDVKWRQWIHNGVIEGSGYPALSPGVGDMPKLANSPAGEWEVRFLPSHGVYDGRFANLGWLQELPDAMTKLTWDNAALFSKADADKLGVTNGSMLKLTVSGKSLEIPAYILPGQPAGVISLPVGQGRTAAGNIGGLASAGVTTCGFNTYALRSSTGLTGATATVEKLGGTYKLVSTLDHFLIDDVGFKGRQKRVGEKHQSGLSIHEGTVQQYVASGRKSSVFNDPHAHGEPSRLQLFPSPYSRPQADPGAPDRFNAPHAWGMAIDMTACIGCQACVVACQSENNIPVVGKEMVEINREMHWIRIDRYFKGERDDPNPQVVFQPMMCVHCENAPCEQVCPVAATVHDTEGLNTMVYNRCIGTRYCSNNCPYKVRRFNYYDYHASGARSGRYRMPHLDWPDTQQKQGIDPLLWNQFNPEVTVRMRGVMEKCTYCTQRIAAAKIEARNLWKQGRRESDLVKDGDVVTACQQACPTEAIIFGNLNDENSAVRKWQANPRAYAVLDDLNSRPRTHHLARLRNPVNEPAPAAGHGGGEHH